MTRPIFRRSHLAIAAAAALASCGDSNPHWQGWIYPNGSDLTRSVAIGGFVTLNECRVSSRTLLANINLQEPGGEPIVGDYECGLKCKRDSGGLNVCAETSK